MAFRNWFICCTQWTTETPKPANSVCPMCTEATAFWATEDMTTEKFKSDNGIVDSPQLDFFALL